MCIPVFLNLSKVGKIMFSFLLQVCQPQKQSAPAEAGPGGVEGGLKGQEAGPSQEGKDAGESRQRAVQQPWRERWLERQLHLQQLMLLMVIVFLKVSEDTLSHKCTPPLPCTGKKEKKEHPGQKITICF